MDGAVVAPAGAALVAVVATVAMVATAEAVRDAQPATRMVTSTEPIANGDGLLTPALSQQPGRQETAGLVLLAVPAVLFWTGYQLQQSVPSQPAVVAAVRAGSGQGRG